MRFEFETYGSPYHLMSGIRFMVIGGIDEEVMKMARMNPLYDKIVIRNSDRPNPPKHNSISDYVEIDVLLHDNDSTLEIVVRLSDHGSEDMKDGEIIRDGSEFTAFVLRDIGNAIRIRTRDGIVHKWNDLDHETQMVPLINGLDAVIPEGDIRIDGTRSKYYIDPSMEGKVGTILKSAVDDTMNHIHTFIHREEI